MTDKAVSTEDLHIALPRNASLEAARLEAVIKTLIENKVETLKNAKRKSSSITSSPKSLFNKLRGTSTPSVSSKEKDEIVSIHSQVSKNCGIKRKRDGRRAAKSEHRKRKTPHYSSPKRTISGKPERTLQFSDEDGNENYAFLHRDPVLNCQDACCCTQNPNEIQIHVDEDFISLNVEEYDSLNAEELVAMKTAKRAQRRKRRRRKQLRKHLKMTAVAVQVNEFKGLHEDELSQRARMTIVLTAFLLLFMCLLLVGITLRMAPLIDDMACSITEHPRVSAIRSLQSKHGTSHRKCIRRKMSLSAAAAPALDFPEIDRLIDDVPALLPRRHMAASLDNIRSWAATPPKRPHRNSCQLSAFPTSRRKSSTRRSSVVASRSRQRASSLAPAKKWLSPEQKAREKRRRRTVYVVVGMFLFILFSCVLVVIVTLTHQTEFGRRNGNSTFVYYTFAPPPDVGQKTTTTSVGVRKENEELMNSLEDSTNHDSLHNLTASVPETL